MEITLEQILSRREERSRRQMELLSLFPSTLISFTMNIPGPEKNSFLISAAFLLGLRRLLGELGRRRIEVIYRESVNLDTGPEAFLVVKEEPDTIKALTVAIEDDDKLGRLFDMDVMGSGGKKIEREKGRKCLICDRDAFVCSSRRIHPLEELKKKVDEVLTNDVVFLFSDYTASLAVRALLYEVSVTPKPGLVDRANNGSHLDMDYFLFLNSSTALHTYFRDAFLIGLSCGGMNKKCFDVLRKRGIKAEREMFASTGGRNTHKGAIFSLGLAVCAYALCGSHKGVDILGSIAFLVSGIVEKDLKGIEKPESFGEKLYTATGITGIRGEAENAFPSIWEFGFPQMKKARKEGMDWNEAGKRTLLSLILHAQDTNMIRRGGEKGLLDAREEVKKVVDRGVYSDSELERLDSFFIERNLSPGGAADLLSLTFFLTILEEESV